MTSGRWTSFSDQLLSGRRFRILAAIIALMYERRRRRNAEVEARQRLLELAHMNRHATAGELSASIAHELGQPLGAVLSNAETAEVLLNSPSPNLNEIKQILTDIVRHNERASETIRRLRTLLKKRTVEVKRINLNKAVREVLEFLSDQAAAQNITMRSMLAPQAPRVDGDRIQLQQVIMNLALNGMEALAGAGTGERRITINTALSGEAAVEVSIADTGPGIPVDKLTKVFEPFFTTKEHGMGMGLFIVRQIVEAHGGRIWAENQHGRGAIFRVSLPLAKTK